MFIGTKAPGYDMDRARKFLRDILKHSDNPSLYAIAEDAKAAGMAIDPAARQVLQPVDTTSLQTSPGHMQSVIDDLIKNKPVSFEEAFDVRSPELFKLPLHVRKAPMEFDKQLIDGAAYSPSRNTIVLSHASLSPGGPFRDHIFHEAQHAVQKHGELSRGSNQAAQKPVLGKHTEIFTQRQNKTLPPMREHENNTMRLLFDPYTAYRNEIGELFASQAEKMAKSGPEGFNVFEESFFPTNKGLSTEWLTHNAEMWRRHPKFAEALARKYPELFMPFAENYNLEKANARSWFGVPGVKSPLAALPRTGPPGIAGPVDLLGPPADMPYLPKLPKSKP
jgi:hypothetical protein